jgi:hypothetical protein
MWGNEHISQLDNGWQMPFIRPRPSKIGGNSVTVNQVECSVSGSNSTALPPAPPTDPIFTDYFGAPVAINGLMPNLTNTTISIYVVPIAHSQSASISSTISYIQSSGATWGLVLYKDANKVTLSLPVTAISVKQSFGNTGGYADAPLYGGYPPYIQGASRHRVTDTLNQSFSIGYVPVQPWLTPPDTICIPNKVGLWLRASRGAFSMTARVTIYWTMP